jgi:hypothetical protein
LVSSLSSRKEIIMPKKISGGGIQSSKLVKVGVKTGPATTNVVNPRGVSQLGYSTGSEIARTGSYTTKNTSLPVFERKAGEQQLGNAKALDVGAGGVGTGRTIYKSGYQSLYGQVVQGSSPGRRDILSEFGEEVTDKATLVRKR